MKTDTIYHMSKGYTIKVTAKPDSTPTNPTKSFSVYRYGKYVSSVDTWEAAQTLVQDAPYPLATRRANEWQACVIQDEVHPIIHVLDDAEFEAMIDSRSNARKAHPVGYSSIRACILHFDEGPDELLIRESLLDVEQQGPTVNDLYLACKDLTKDYGKVDHRGMLLDIVERCHQLMSKPTNKHNVY